MAELVKLGGIWKNKTKNGETMLSGPFGNASILIFVNKYKEKASHPDYMMFITQNKGEAKKPSPPASPDIIDDDDDIPF